MFKKAGNILLWMVSGALLFGALGIIVFATPLFGNRMLIVRSGSMEPAISVGDVVIVRPDKDGTYLNNDVASFRMPGQTNAVVTHRITEVSEEGYRTKGDANAETDGWLVPKGDVLGRQLFVVPYVGKLLAFAKTKAGFATLVVLPALLVIMAEARVIWREMRKKMPKLERGVLATPSMQPAPTPGEEASSTPGEVATVVHTQPIPVRRYVDGISLRLAVILLMVSVMTPATFAVYTDTGVSSNNVFTAAENFGVGLGDVVINEVMWMGSWSGNSAKINDEWIELRNMTSEIVDIAGWEIDGAGSGASEVIVLTSGSIPPNGFYLISNYEADHASSALRDDLNVDLEDSNLGFDNSGEQLTLKDNFGTIIDQAPLPPPAWPAGVNDNDTPLKQSMSRNDPPEDGTVDGNWHTCTDPDCNNTTYWDVEDSNYGTPKAANL